jgi:hypothetical protein
MKKLFVVIVLSVLSEFSFSQVRFGAEAGLNLFNTTHTVFGSSNPNTKETGGFQPGIKLGLIGAWTFRKKFTVQTGVHYSMKGFRKLDYVRKNYGPEENVKWHTHIGYLEIPLNLLLNIDDHFYFGPGGYGAIGVNGTGTFKVTGELRNDYSFTTALTLDNPQMLETTGFKRFDYGFQFSIGYRINNCLFIQGQFSQGLEDIMPDIPFTEKFETYRNWGISISSGWYIR